MHYTKVKERKKSWNWELESFKAMKVRKWNSFWYGPTELGKYRNSHKTIHLGSSFAFEDENIFFYFWLFVCLLVLESLDRKLQTTFQLHFMRKSNWFLYKIKIISQITKKKFCTTFTCLYTYIKYTQRWKSNFTTSSNTSQNICMKLTQKYNTYFAYSAANVP